MDIRSGLTQGVSLLSTCFRSAASSLEATRSWTLCQNVQLYPGMPAQVMIPTTERTAFQYIVGPLVMSFNQAFRQK